MRSDLGFSFEPPDGIEPSTYALRVGLSVLLTSHRRTWELSGRSVVVRRRSARLAAPPALHQNGFTLVSKSLPPAGQELGQAVTPFDELLQSVQHATELTQIAQFALRLWMLDWRWPQIASDTHRDGSGYVL